MLGLRLTRQALHVRIDHHLDELLERDLRLPAELPAGLGRIAHEVIYLRRADELLVDVDVLLGVEADVRERESREVRTECVSPVAIT